MLVVKRNQLVSRYCELTAFALLGYIRAAFGFGIIDHCRGCLLFLQCQLLLFDAVVVVRLPSVRHRAPRTPVCRGDSALLVVAALAHAVVAIDKILGWE